MAKNSTQNQLEDLVVQTAGEMAESLSLNRLVCQIYALLYISPKPVSLDEMVEKLKTSKGSASVNIRILEDWNAVKKILIPGSRKDHYTAEPDFFKVILERLEKGMERRLRYAEEKIDLIARCVNARNGKDKELKSFYLNRIKQFQEIKDLLQSLLKFLPQIRTSGKFKLIKTLLG